MIKRCFVCNKEYYCRPCHKNRSKYCSVNCHNIAQTPKPITDKENIEILAKNYEKSVIKNEHGCYGWLPKARSWGYAFVRDGRNKSIKAHRASWIIHRGPIPEGELVLHHCDNRECTKIAHLFVGKHKDNTRDMWEKGRQGRGVFIKGSNQGEKHNKCKLKEDEVKEIRKLLKTKLMTQDQIAKLFNISPYTIYDIKKKRSWNHVED